MCLLVVVSDHSCVIPPTLPPPQLQAKLTEARAKVESSVDPSTGRPLYQPQTGRAPHFSRYAPGQGVGDYLYSLQTERVGGYHIIASLQLPLYNCKAYFYAKLTTGHVTGAW